MKEAEILLLMDQVVAAWNRRDLDAFLGNLDEAVTWSDPAMLVGPAAGKAAVREFCENVLRAFPDFAMQIREPICLSPSGERCAVPWRVTATHSGRFDPFGFAPTNQRITMEGVDLIEFSEAKITRIETHFNVIPAMEQALRLRPFPRRGLKKALLVAAQRALAWRARRAAPPDASGPGEE